MKFNLSVVNIIPDAYKDAINQIAELYGCGENNLSVKLIDSNGAIYWGCHSWWKPEDYAIFSGAIFSGAIFSDAKFSGAKLSGAKLSGAGLRAQIVPSVLQPALKFLYERLTLDGDAQDNWQAVLDELGLAVVETQTEISG